MKSIDDMTRAEKVAACARAAYEANRTFCIAMDDYAPSPWEEAKSVWLKGITATVEAVLAGDAASMLHKKWVRVMTEAGWSYAPVKNSTLKQTPKLASFNDLPATAKRQYNLTVDTVLAMAKALKLDMWTLR
jgi:hypothetical protein